MTDLPLFDDVGSVHGVGGVTAGVVAGVPLTPPGAGHARHAPSRQTTGGEGVHISTGHTISLESFNRYIHRPKSIHLNPFQDLVGNPVDTS